MSANHSLCQQLEDILWFIDPSSGLHVEAAAEPDEDSGELIDSVDIEYMETAITAIECHIVNLACTLRSMSQAILDGDESVHDQAKHWAETLAHLTPSETD